MPQATTINTETASNATRHDTQKKKRATKIELVPKIDGLMPQATTINTGGGARKCTPVGGERGNKTTNLPVTFQDPWGWQTKSTVFVAVTWTGLGEREERTNRGR